MSQQKTRLETLRDRLLAQAEALTSDISITHSPAIDNDERVGTAGIAFARWRSISKSILRIDKERVKRFVLDIIEEFDTRNSTDNTDHVCPLCELAKDIHTAMKLSPSNQRKYDKYVKLYGTPCATCPLTDFGKNMQKSCWLTGLSEKLMLARQGRSDRAIEELYQKLLNILANEV